MVPGKEHVETLGSRSDYVHQPGWMKSSGTMLGGSFDSDYTDTCACPFSSSLVLPLNKPNRRQLSFEELAGVSEHGLQRLRYRCPERAPEQ